ncbi:hypothetical protein ACFQ0O_20000 [Saccharopolyspora spinosporotrichia]
MTGFGLGWVNAATDYSRCLPRTCSGAAVVGWACSARRRWRCWVFGLLLAGSSPELGGALAADPVGAPPPSCRPGTSSRSWSWRCSA